MKKVLLFFIISCSIFSCQKTEEIERNELMELTKNDFSHTISTFKTRLVESDIGDKKLSILCNVGTGVFELTVTNKAWQNSMKDGIIQKTYDTKVYGDPGKNTACEDIEDKKTCDSAKVSFFEGQNQYFSHYPDLKGGQVTILNVDIEKREISGIFDVKLRTFTEKSYHFIGTFDNIVYESY